MPVIKSSKKRARQAVGKTARNGRLKRNIRLAFQALEAKLAGGKKTEIADAQSKISSLLDTAVKKNVFHKNKAARRKSQVAKAVRDKTATTKKKPPAKGAGKAAPRPKTAKKPSAGKP